MNARGLLVLAAAVALVGAVVLAWQRFEGSAPEVVAPAELILGKTPQDVEIVLGDADSGLRSASIRLLHQAGSRALHEQVWGGGLIAGGAPGSREERIALTLDPSELAVPDGTATLVVDVRDWSWRDALAGNRSEISIPVQVDTRPPSVKLSSGLTYVYRGGSAAAVYQIADDVEEDGVRVGDAFFRGYPHPSGKPGQRVALFAIPVDAALKPEVRVVAIDAAGNEGSVRFPAHVLERVFRDSRLPLSDEFIERVATPLASEAGLPTGDAATTFKSVNETLRTQNEATIRERLAERSEEQLWQGAFDQMAGSKVMSRFAEHRSYLRGDTPVSAARHYGFDLASTARAPITAAGAGVVVLAEDLGIYGLCVVVDHGIGIASVYGHLSEIDVEVGDRVEQGARLGRSGDTGLAAGDHLHFAFLVGDTYVDPLEWWDPKWVRSHVEVRLEN